MNRKDFLSDYLQFSYKERIAVISLVILAIALIILPRFFPAASAASSMKADTSWMAAANKLMQKKADTVFYYDRPRYNYASNNNYQTSYARYRYSSNYSYRDSTPNRGFYKRAERKINIVEINSADSAAWEALPGIGARLAARLIAFRDKLGGFYSVEQVKELYGLPDSTFQLLKPYLTVNAKLVHKININSAAKEELKVHPYIRWQLASMIVDYRKEHGTFASIDDLKKIQQITDDVFVKMAPYFVL